MYSVCSTEQRDGYGFPTGERERDGGSKREKERQNERERARELEVNREVCQWRSSSSSHWMECILCTSCRQNFYKSHLTWESEEQYLHHSPLSHYLSQHLNIRMKVVSTAANKPLSLMLSYTNNHFDSRSVSKDHNTSAFSQSHHFSIPFWVLLNECTVCTL